MRNSYSDPTANAAIGAVDREFNKLKKEAKRLITDYRNGSISLDELKKGCLKFQGIYRRIPLIVLEEEKKKEQAQKD